jgi:hypothetical protein
MHLPVNASSFGSDVAERSTPSKTKALTSKTALQMICPELLPMSYLAGAQQAVWGGAKITKESA